MRQLLTNERDNRSVTLIPGTRLNTTGLPADTATDGSATVVPTATREVNGAKPSAKVGSANRGRADDLFGKASRAADRAIKQESQTTAATIYGAHIGFEVVEEAKEKPAEKAEESSDKKPSKPSRKTGFWAKAARIGAAICLGITIPMAMLVGKPPLNAVPEPDFCAVTAVAEVGASQCTTGNRIGYFVDGPEFVQELVAGIDSAKSTVWLEFFHVGSDASIEPIFEALERAHSRGVDIRMVIDNRQKSGAFNDPMEQRMADDTVARLRSIGAQIQMPTYSQYSVNHRKMGVFDGQRAMVMGQNLGANYTRPLSDGWTYHDMGMTVSGPAVRDIAEVFGDSWTRAGGRALRMPERLAAFTDGPYVDAPVQIVHHNAREDRAIEREMIQRIDASGGPISVVNGFGFTDDLVDALVRAARRGQDVNVVWGQASRDAALMAGQAFDTLREGGVKLHYYPSPLHMKLLVAGNVVMSGSANNDGFSAVRNDEMVMQVNHPQLALEITNRIVVPAIAKSKPLVDAPVTPQNARDFGIAYVLTPLVNH